MGDCALGVFRDTIPYVRSTACEMRCVIGVLLFSTIVGATSVSTGVNGSLSLRDYTGPTACSSFGGGSAQCAIDAVLQPYQALFHGSATASVGSIGINARAFATARGAAELHVAASFIDTLTIFGGSGLGLLRFTVPHIEGATTGYGTDVPRTRLTSNGYSFLIRDYLSTAVIYAPFTYGIPFDFGMSTGGDLYNSTYESTSAYASASITGFAVFRYTCRSMDAQGNCLDGNGYGYTPPCLSGTFSNCSEYEAPITEVSYSGSGVSILAAVPVPEPSYTVLFALGLATLTLLRRQRLIDHIRKPLRVRRPGVHINRALASKEGC
jgi:hypothetical protein